MGWCLECHRDVKAKQGDSESHSAGEPDDEHGVDARRPRRSPQAPQSARELLRVPPMSKRAPYPVHEPWPGSPQYWRSIEERGRLEDPEKMRQENAAEFPKGHVETPPTDEACLVSRRGLLGAMTATFALVGAEGCRRPIEKIVPYTKMPEDVIPGVPSHYATVIQRRGDAVGLARRVPRGAAHEDRRQRVAAVEPRRGRPGHPGHDPRPLRSRALHEPAQGAAPRPASWGDFEARARPRSWPSSTRTRAPACGVLMPPTLSPTVLRMRAALAQRFPKARVHTWSAVSDSNAREGARLAFGEPINTALLVRPRARHPLARQRLPPDRDRKRPRDQDVRGGAPAALRRTTR